MRPASDRSAAWGHGHQSHLDDVDVELVVLPGRRHEAGDARRRVGQVQPVGMCVPRHADVRPANDRRAVGEVDGRLLVSHTIAGKEPGDAPLRIIRG